MCSYAAANDMTSHNCVTVTLHAVRLMSCPGAEKDCERKLEQAMEGRAFTVNQAQRNVERLPYQVL